MAALLTADDEAAALEQLHELGCTDGLPVVVPTPERVERCLTSPFHSIRRLHVHSTQRGGLELCFRLGSKHQARL